MGSKPIHLMSVADRAKVPTIKDYFIEKTKNNKTSLKISLKYYEGCLLYTSPSPRDVEESRMPSSA